MNVALSATDPFTLAMTQLATTVEEKSGGTLTIDTFPGGGLTGSRDAPLSLSRGTIDLDVNAAVFYEALLPAFQILSAPFTGLTGERVLEQLATGKEARQILDEQLAEKNVKILAMWSLGWPGIVSMEPLNTVESFSGKKIRMASVFIGADVLRNHGAEVVLMSGAEAVDALNRRLIDGGTTGPRAMLARGYPSFAKYWQMWPVDAGPMVLWMNLAKFNELSPEQQAILTSTSEQIARELTATILRADIAALSESIEQGVQHLSVPAADLRTLASEARPLLEKFVAESEPRDANLRFLKLLLGD